MGETPVGPEVVIILKRKQLAGGLGTSKKRSSGPSLGRTGLQRQRFDSKDPGFEALVQVLELQRQGVVLLGRHRRVDFLNSTADELIANSQILQTAGRTLRAVPTALEHWLGTCMRIIDSPGRAGISPIPDCFHVRYGSERLSLLARRVHSSDDRGDLCCLFLSELHDSVIDAAGNFAEMFSLSDRETLVVGYILDGCSVPEIAAHMGVKDSTVQTYVKRIHQKTGLSRQSDIVSLGLSLNIRSL